MTVTLGTACSLLMYTVVSCSNRGSFLGALGLQAAIDLCVTMSKDSLPDGLAIHEISKCDHFLMKLQSNLMNRHPPPILDVCFSELLHEE
ncbi:conserved hypothetical protein [Ricinus communis]|uniref:Uncharacterized protein n=1 Tax=Ricinus communis TaxID=3988 RepID=B9SX42_RICCO|nr:conserved hypothetical protein [Ricinus communis]